MAPVARGLEPPRRVFVQAIGNDLADAGGNGCGKSGSLS
jgi:hypothetical protein